jgi:hypothetical protein
MAKQNTVTTEAVQPITKSNIELEERIRARAYELYQQRDGEPGHELDDWLQAESELTQPNAQKAAS